MEGEIEKSIKVWIIAITSLCYCYYVVARIRRGIMRLLSLLPIFYLFIILPLNLNSIHFAGLTIFFLVWLGNFKLLLFAFDQGPLTPLPPKLFHFISIASLPIKIKQHPPPKPNVSMIITPRYQKQSKPISPKCHKTAQIHFVGYKSLASYYDNPIIRKQTKYASILCVCSLLFTSLPWCGDRARPVCCSCSSLWV
ncbi:hypothetical protein SLA2020_389630 [Shorea laevis]